MDSTEHPFSWIRLSFVNRIFTFLVLGIQKLNIMLRSMQIEFTTYLRQANADVRNNISFNSGKVFCNHYGKFSR